MFALLLARLLQLNWRCCETFVLMWSYLQFALMQTGLIAYGEFQATDHKFFTVSCVENSLQLPKPTQPTETRAAGMIMGFTGWKDQDPREGLEDISAPLEHINKCYSIY